jgi:hypothetical protein
MRDHHIRVQDYAWSLLCTMFSEVFNEDDWSILFDNVFSNHPGYLLLTAVAYATVNRTRIMHCHSETGMWRSHWFTQNNVSQSSGHSSASQAWLMSCAL